MEQAQIQSILGEYYPSLLEFYKKIQQFPQENALVFCCSHSCHRLFHLFSSFLEEEQNAFSTLLSVESLPLMENSLRENFQRTGEIPKIYLVDTLLVYGKRMNRLLYQLEDIYGWEQSEAEEIQEEELASPRENLLKKAVEIHIFALNQDFSLLEQQYRSNLQLSHSYSINQWKLLSKQVTALLGISLRESSVKPWEFSLKGEQVKRQLWEATLPGEFHGMVLQKEEFLRKHNHYRVIMGFYPSIQDAKTIFVMRMQKNASDDKVLLNLSLYMGEGRRETLLTAAETLWETGLPSFFSENYCDFPPTMGKDDTALCLSQGLEAYGCKLFLDFILGELAVSQEDFLKESSHNGKLVLKTLLRSSKQEEMQKKYRNLQEMLAQDLSNNSSASAQFFEYCQSLSPFWTQESFKHKESDEVFHTSSMGEEREITAPLWENLQYYVAKYALQARHPGYMVAKSNMIPSRQKLVRRGDEKTFGTLLELALQYQADGKIQDIPTLVAYFSAMESYSLVKCEPFLQNERIIPLVLETWESEQCIFTGFRTVLSVMGEIAALSRGNKQIQEEEIVEFLDKMVEKAVIFPDKTGMFFLQMEKFLAWLRLSGTKAEDYFFTLEDDFGLSPENTTLLQLDPCIDEKKWKEILQQRKALYRLCLEC